MDFAAPTLGGVVKAVLLPNLQLFYKSKQTKENFFLMKNSDFFASYFVIFEHQ